MKYYSLFLLITLALAACTHKQSPQEPATRSIDDGTGIGIQEDMGQGDPQIPRRHLKQVE